MKDMNTTSQTPKIARKRISPAESAGPRIGAEIRARTNSLTDSQREALVQRGMELIYGASAKIHAHRSRH
jgi:hypothetical protein